MKIKKERRNLFIPFGVLLLSLGVLGFLAYAYINNPSRQNSNTVNTSKTNTDESKQGEASGDQQETVEQNPNDKDTPPNTDQPATPTNDTTSDKKQVQMFASTDTSGGTVYIRGGINYPVTGGTCYATLSGPSGETLRKDTTLLQNPASTDCKTIAVSSSELASGTWKVVLHYTSDTYEGASDEVTFSL